MPKVRLSCGTMVPASVLDELAWASLDKFLSKPHASDIKSAASAVIRKLDSEGKLLGELKEVLGWEPPTNG